VLPYDATGVPPPGYHLEENPRKGLIVAGALTFGVPYLISLTIGGARRSEADRWLLLPVMGPVELLTSRSTSFRAAHVLSRRNIRRSDGRPNPSTRRGHNDFSAERSPIGREAAFSWTATSAIQGAEVEAYPKMEDPMRWLKLITPLSALTLFGCSGSAGDQVAPPGGGAGTTAGFDPPPPAAGYTRIVSPVVAGIQPGDDLTVCQYLQAPLDRDLDILDAEGYQSDFGHHAVAFASAANVPVGTSGPCTEKDNLSGSFLGGVGGEGGGGVKLPDGVAFRLIKGNAIMLNVHFLNTGPKVVDGQSVVDFKFAEVDPARKVASLFVNGNMSFKVGANAKADAVAECPVGRDIDFILFTNHMHDYGTTATTHLQRGSAVNAELVHEDPVWTYEMQFRANYTKWPAEEPLHLVPGDKLITNCEWINDTAEMVTYPREMCFGIGYFLTDGNGPTPMCINGKWIER